MQRNSNLDLLRIIACFAVVLIHTTAVWINRGVVSSFDAIDVLNKLGRIYIIFIPLSGAMLLSNNANINYKEFLAKRFSKIGRPLFFYSILYAMFSMFVSDINWKGAISSIFFGEPFYHLWFMYMLIGLYLITPMLLFLKNQIGEKQFLFCGIAITILSIPISYFSSLFWVIKFIPYIGYFMLGYSILEYRSNSLKYIGIISLVISYSLAFIAESYLLSCGYSISLYSDFSPFIITAVLSLMMIFVNANQVKANSITRLSKYTFHAYLIHAAIIKLMPEINTISSLEYTILSTMIVFVLSMIYGYIVEEKFNFKGILNVVKRTNN